MDSKRLVALIVVSVIIGFGIGYGISYAMYQPQISELQFEVSNLQSEISDLYIETIPVKMRSATSMRPTIELDDIVLIRTVDMSEINAAPYPDGDIIAFYLPHSEDIIIHRAIEKIYDGDTLYFRTKGDGNAAPDAKMVPEYDVIGIVIAIIPKPP